MDRPDNNTKGRKAVEAERWVRALFRFGPSFCARKSQKKIHQEGRSHHESDLSLLGNSKRLRGSQIRPEVRRKRIAVSQTNKLISVYFSHGTVSQ